MANILLVEDNPADQKLTMRAFEKSIIKTNIKIVEDGQQAMDYLLHTGIYANQPELPDPDIILLDINMPKKDGKQVLREIRNHPDLKAIPVIILTTSDLAIDVKESYMLGANAYITKPVKINDFMDVINRLQEFWFKLTILPNRKDK